MSDGAGILWLLTGTIYGKIENGRLYWRPLPCLPLTGLEKLLGLLDNLMDDLDDGESDEDTEAHEEWEESMDEVTDLMDEVQSRIEDLEDE